MSTLSPPGAKRRGDWKPRRPVAKHSAKALVRLQTLKASISSITKGELYRCNRGCVSVLFELRIRILPNRPTYLPIVRATELHIQGSSSALARCMMHPEYAPPLGCHQLLLPSAWGMHTQQPTTLHKQAQLDECGPLRPTLDRAACGHNARVACDPCMLLFLQPGAHNALVDP